MRGGVGLGGDWAEIGVGDKNLLCVGEGNNVWFESVTGIAVAT